MTASGRSLGAPDDASEPRAAGVWTLAGGRLIIAEPGGPATILVPSEQVRLLAVDLPLASKAKRLEALPFAIEEQIAEPAESVHLALGAEIEPKRYLVGVVRHEEMIAWIEAAEAAGLGHAAMVPDALALPRPGEGEWAVDLTGDRATVRAGDGTGFACPAAMLLPAWQAAGRPHVLSYGAALPSEMAASEAAAGAVALSDRLLEPALDLRQGPYARRRAGLPNMWRRLGWIVAIGAAAHVGIAMADTLMLQRIADRRAEETRAAFAAAAPGATPGEDLAASVTDMLPAPSSAAPDLFLPLLNRLSGALGPLSGALTVRSLSYQASTLTLDLDGTDPSLPGRIDAALRGAGITGSVTRSPDGAIRVTANAA
ncbi:type II secretion system protein GspL [Sphingomonas sp.]|uniref:type II secretion system protein GspL n=1 Tax=Sphingomonas sp. TaxID=28214 RepID=UPI0025DF49A4|nr:type II secretion system protein GspL [Sphingomonas sp.]